MKTANSGYLTRRLVDVAQDCIIVEPDCGTERGLTVKAVMDGGEVVAGLEERTLGRTTAEDVLDPITGEVMVPANTLIEEPEAEAIEKAAVEFGENPLRADLRQPGRRLRGLLRARPRPRHAGQHR